MGLATACVLDPPGMLRELLTDAITLCEHLAGREQQQRTAPDPAVWHEVCRPAPAH